MRLTSVLCMATIIATGFVNVGCSGRAKEKVVIIAHSSDSDDGNRPTSVSETAPTRDEPATEAVATVQKADVSLARNAARINETLRQVAMQDDYSWLICEIPLSPEDLYGLTKPQLRILRNTIYARHGRRFKSADLQRYFSQFDWYYPTVNEVYEHQLSAVEKHNIKLIQAYE